MDLSSPQQWNAYSYANNSPITSSDPTGLNPFDAQWDGAPPSKHSQQNMEAAYGTVAYNSSTRPPSVEDQVAAQQAQVRQQAERKQRECRASFWCRNAGTVGTVAGIAAGVIVGGACTLGSWGVGAVGCAAIGGFVGGAVSSLVTNGLDADEESWGQLAGEALVSGLFGAALGAGGALLGGAAFGAGVAITSGMGSKAAGQMAMAGMCSSLSSSGGATSGGSASLRGYADSLRSSYNKRTGPHFAAEFRSSNGKTYHSGNGHGMKPREGGLLDIMLRTVDHHLGCAEIGCLIQAEAAGDDILSGTMNVVKVRGVNSNGTAHGSPATPCPASCRPALDLLGTRVN